MICTMMSLKMWRSLNDFRTHKRSVADIGELADQITNFKNEYPDAYVEVIALVEEFQKKLINEAL